MALGPEFATEVSASFVKDLVDFEEITLESWRQRSIADRVREVTTGDGAKVL